MSWVTINNVDKSYKYNFEPKKQDSKENIQYGLFIKFKNRWNGMLFRHKLLSSKTIREKTSMFSLKGKLYQSEYYLK